MEKGREAVLFGGSREQRVIKLIFRSDYGITVGNGDSFFFTG